MKCIRIAFGILVWLLPAFTSALAQDPGWPRLLQRPGGTMILYPPQVDNWQNHSDLTWRQAFQLTPNGGKQAVGAANLEGSTLVDTDRHLVRIYNLRVLNTYFPGLDPGATANMDQLARSFLPPSVDVALERLVSYMPKPDSVQTVALKNDPPVIFVAFSPAILLGVDGEPVFADVSPTDLEFVVNTTWPLFRQKKTSTYYLLVNDLWLTAKDPHGPWSAIKSLPEDFGKLPDNDKFAAVRKAAPPPVSSAPVPKVFYSTVPAEVILFEGRPHYADITGTPLMYADNTDSPVFLDVPGRTYYYLAAGRWFSASDLAGPWTFASLNLPPAFAQIPLSSPASAILASVPGTPQAKDAVLIAQIPTTIEIDPAKAAAQASVTYTGAPKFAPVEGTTLQYATNTPDKVIQVGDVYYLCLQGVWFMSSTPQGPWTTAASVPQVIYTIPPSSPVYNVTYVTQVTTSSGSVQSSYTSGYLGAFVMGAAVGAIVCSGTGWYYPPYIGYPPMGYPIYHPYPTPYGGAAYYNGRTGAYGVSQTAYGPYGSATRAAQYNPYTGTYSRGASASTAYGRQSVGQAYNPYTGTYGATHQGSSPTAQWGQSYAQRGNQAAYGQHYSTANGTVGSIQGSQGGHAYGTSSAYGSTYAGKSSSGDIYAGHDGNVYQNNGGGWQKYNNSTNSWSNVNTQQAQQQAHQQAQSYEQEHPNSQANMQQHEQNFNSERSSGNWSTQNLNSEMENRQNGAAQSERFQQYQHSGGGSGGGGSWGGGHSFGGYGGGGRSWGGGGRRR